MSLELYVIYRHPSLAVWSQPSAMLFLRTSVTLFLKLERHGVLTLITPEPESAAPVSKSSLSTCTPRRLPSSVCVRSLFARVPEHVSLDSGSTSRSSLLTCTPLLVCVWTLLVDRHPRTCRLEWPTVALHGGAMALHHADASGSSNSHTQTQYFELLLYTVFNVKRRVNAHVLHARLARELSSSCTPRTCSFGSCVSLDFATFLLCDLFALHFACGWVCSFVLSAGNSLCCWVCSLPAVRYARLLLLLCSSGLLLAMLFLFFCIHICALRVLGVDDPAHHLLDIHIAFGTSFAGAYVETPL